MRLAISLAVSLLLSCSSDKRGAPQRGSTSGSATSATGSATGAGSGAVPVDDGFSPAALGALSFHLTEGSPAARAAFQRGMLALHSFWYDEAQRQFSAAIAADATMNMPYWGLAMSHIKLLWGEDDVGAARDILSKMPDPDRLGPREQAWVMATIGLLQAPDVRTSRKTYVQALEGLSSMYPDDETATFLAVALLSTTRPEDADNKAVRERAAALASEVFKRNPNHPGAAHYMIHAYDTPELAPRALDVAKQYAKIAPAAFHSLHMPAHIFSRLGMWSEAIASCHAAWDASIAAAKAHKLSANHHDFHSLAWLVDMPFELGHKQEAEAALTSFADAIKGGLSRQHRSLYAMLVASFLERTGQWERVEELLAPLASAPVEEARVATPSGPRTGEPAAHCAPSSVSPADLGERIAATDTRAFAAAMRKDVATTQKLIGELDRAHTQLREALKSFQPADQLIKLDATHARRMQELRARAAGDDRALLRTLRASIATVGADSGGESTPSAFVVHEQIADALLRVGDVEAARAEYARALEQHPGRAHALLGSARVAVKAGDRGAAHTYYGRLVELWKQADAGTPGLDEARASQTP